MPCLVCDPGVSFINKTFFFAFNFVFVSFQHSPSGSNPKGVVNRPTAGF